MAEIKLNIKSLDSEDQILQSTLQTTVKEVKLQIEREWESHPKPSDQRLVYSGKLLQDSSILNDVLRLTDARDENDAFTIHLVCRLTKPSLPKPEIRKRSTVPPSEPKAEPVQTGGVAAQTGVNPWAAANPEQAALMQQMYTNYINQYMQYMQAIGATPTWPQVAPQPLIEQTNQIAEEARQVPPVFDSVAAAAVAGAVANNIPAENVPQVQQDVQQQQQQPLGENLNGVNGVEPNVMMNAGAGGIGAMEDEDELNGGQRDILDWCYVVTRVLVLFSVVYFYSSLARFALAAGLGIIFYLYNNGFFGQREANEQNAAVNEVRPVAGAAGDENRENIPPNENGQPENQNRAEDQPEAPPAPPHVLNVMATFVTTFFTSLMPNDPQIV